jgi:hypothetical protein
MITVVSQVTPPRTTQVRKGETSVKELMKRSYVTALVIGLLGLVGSVSAAGVLVSSFGLYVFLEGPQYLPDVVGRPLSGGEILAGLVGSAFLTFSACLGIAWAILNDSRRIAKELRAESAVTDPVCVGEVVEEVKAVA